MRTFFLRRGIAFAALVAVLILTAGCAERSAAEIKTAFESNADTFQIVADALLVREAVAEVTTERPSLLAEEGVWQRCGGLYWVGTEEEIPLEEVVAVRDLFRACSIVSVYVFHEEEVVLFRMESRLGSGKYLLFTRQGAELPDEYLRAVEWVTDVWYIAES